ncbi:hypothetical protein [Myceligenerans pegani]|nr:hypothetical protein [Myceligenerans sp. TRM 65318]
MNAEIARLVRPWGPPAWPDIWRPVRETGVGDRTTLLDRIRTVLDGEPDLVEAWNNFSGDKRYTPSWALEGETVSWVMPRGRRGPARTFDDETEACAQFVMRDALWSVERRFVDIEEPRRTWSLMHGRDFLALLTVTDHDWPWLHANLSPAPAFDAWRSAFDDERRLLERIDDDAEAWEAAYDVISSALTLRDPEGTDAEMFLLHIDGDAAWWRSA